MSSLTVAFSEQPYETRNHNQYGRVASSPEKNLRPSILNNCGSQNTIHIQRPSYDSSISFRDELNDLNNRLAIFNDKLKDSVLQSQYYDTTNEANYQKARLEDNIRNLSNLEVIAEQRRREQSREINKEVDDYYLVEPQIRICDVQPSQKSDCMEKSVMNDSLNNSSFIKKSSPLRVRPQQEPRQQNIQYSRKKTPIKPIKTEKYKPRTPKQAAMFSDEAYLGYISTDKYQIKAQEEPESNLDNTSPLRSFREHKGSGLAQENSRPSLTRAPFDVSRSHTDLDYARRENDRLEAMMDQDLEQVNDQMSEQLREAVAQNIRITRMLEETENYKTPPKQGVDKRASSPYKGMNYFETIQTIRKTRASELMQSQSKNHLRRTYHRENAKRPENGYTTTKPKGPLVDDMLTKVSKYDLDRNQVDLKKIQKLKTEKYRTQAEQKVKLKNETDAAKKEEEVLDKLLRINQMSAMKEQQKSNRKETAIRHQQQLRDFIEVSKKQENALPVKTPEFTNSVHHDVTTKDKTSKRQPYYAQIK